jgi:pimeloyl-ACP methyl ester carboxylesterase
VKWEIKMKLAKNLLAAGALITSVGGYVAAQRYRDWRMQIERRLIADRRIAHTRLGPVEYQRVGDGPVVLFSHGAPGGYDQGFLLNDFVAAGFSVLTPSRPGYLGTPLYTGRTVEAQADALAALLDTLEIESVVVAGASSGGPIALQLALRHPQRVSALVMMSAVSEQYRPNANTTNTALGKIYLNNTGIVDIGLWLFDLFTSRFPAQSIRTTLQTDSTLDANQLDATVAQVMRDPQQIDWFQRLIRSTAPLSLRKAGLDNDLAQFAQMPMYRLESITAPTLVVHGLADADVHYKHALNVAKRVPNAQLHTLENSGHLIWLGDEWRDFRPKLLTFLTNNTMHEKTHAPNN